MDRGAWWAPVPGVTGTRTQLSDCHSLTHPRILAWEIPWAEEPGGLQSTGSQRVGTRLSD